ncbi:MAG: glycosyltransferase [Planctomycetes bacterium]|nr:glycosyltransferase [Planctomycetota bacterium]
MRILYLTAGFPWPLESGYLRHYHFIRELSRKHAVVLLSLAGRGYLPEHAAALEPIVERVQAFPLGRRRGKTFRMLLGRERALRDMAETAEGLVRRGGFDVVLFSGKQTRPVIDRVGTLPVVADVCDAESVRHRARLDHARWYQRPRLFAGWLWLRRVERRILGRARHVLFASGRDRDALIPPAGLTMPPATVVPNGVDIDYWRRGERWRGTNAIVFTGAMHYPPNADAAVYLARRILPRVREAVPNVELLIVGRDPTEAVRHVGRLPGVTVTGRVDDVRPWLERAAVFAAPLRFAAGIQNKLLEALAMELPVVASTPATAGLILEGEEVPPVTTADDPDEFARRLIAELQAAAQDPSPRSRGRDFVAEHFSWTAAGLRLESVLAGCAAVAGTTASSRPVARERRQPVAVTGASRGAS